MSKNFDQFSIYAKIIELTYKYWSRFPYITILWVIITYITWKTKGYFFTFHLMVSGKLKHVSWYFSIVSWVVKYGRLGLSEKKGANNEQ